MMDNKPVTIGNDTDRSSIIWAFLIAVGCVSGTAGFVTTNALKDNPIPEEDKILIGQNLSALFDKRPSNLPLTPYSHEKEKGSAYVFYTDIDKNGKDDTIVIAGFTRDITRDGLDTCLVFDVVMKGHRPEERGDVKICRPFLTPQF